MAPVCASLESDAVLRDGSTVHLRLVGAEDEAQLLELFEGLSLESRTFRFFSAGTDLSKTARLMAGVGGRNGCGLVATLPATGKLIGHATYIGDGSGMAEVAFAIVDQMQALGLASLMLGQLALLARERGVESFYAEVLPENHQMIDVFEGSGFDVTVARRPGTLHFEFSTGPPPLALRHFAELARLHPATEKRSVETADGTASTSL